MGLTVLDAGVVIALLDANDRHHQEARSRLHRARAEGQQFVLPASAYAEVLVGPMRRDPAAADVVNAFVDALPAVVVLADREVAAIAASLRAGHPRLRLPDALVVATASALAAERIITTDAAWPELGIQVEVLRSAE